MSETGHVELANSASDIRDGSTRIGDIDDNERIDISVHLKDPDGDNDAPIDRETLEAGRREACRAHVEKLAAFAAEHGLALGDIDTHMLRVRMTGPASAHAAAFKTSLARYEHADGAYRGRSGSLSIPGELADCVDAVLGHDNRPLVTRAPKPEASPDAAPGGPSAYLPTQLAALYGVPATSAASQNVAIIEFGGGYSPSDFSTACANMGLPTPPVVARSVRGGYPNFSPNPHTASPEVALDMQVVAGVAPGARIVLYFVGARDLNGWMDGILAAVHDRSYPPSTISISWGGDERDFQAVLASTNAAFRTAGRLGASVLVSSGDHLATNGTPGQLNVQFGACCPYATGCGGTFIETSNGAIVQESVWNRHNYNPQTGRYVDTGSGGGVSLYWRVPSYQQSANLPTNAVTGASGRCVPDVAADADPNSGVLLTFAGHTLQEGGTSAVAPFWAGMISVVNAARAAKGKAPIGFLNPTLYANPSALNPVTIGSNKPQGTGLGYDATNGYSAATGLGTPNNPALFDLLFNA